MNNRQTISRKAFRHVETLYQAGLLLVDVMVVKQAVLLANRVCLPSANK